jgi:hypothetical protein
MGTMPIFPILFALVFSAAIGSVHNPVWAKDAADPRVVETLIRLDSENLWGEAVLKEGGVRPIRVVSIKGDSVVVREVIGALHERSATYAISEFRSLRELGEHRIPLRRAPFRPSRSMTTAMALELVVPGGGYFYAGESRQGLVMLGFSALVVATAVTTGKSGVAGWVPIASWFKIASLVHLVDEVQAMNATHESGRSEAMSALPSPPVLIELSRRF